MVYLDELVADVRRGNEEAAEQEQAEAAEQADPFGMPSSMGWTVQNDE